MDNKRNDSVLFKHPLLETFVFYSIFRAIYGAIILIITWTFATNSNLPSYFSVLFLIFSMIFSRYIFKKIKTKKNNE
ncbi:MAG: hypothetical protein CBC89_00280 [Euryarchaeota archaeon TMED129]|nr:MAG: hypothetical protein CBC89_00280 [Euryarchaeota archaeon TMED129]